MASKAKLKVTYSNLIPLYAVSLRLISAVSKFALIIFASKELPASDIGIYGLAISLIAIFVQWIGLEFYVYSQREALSSPDDKHTMISSWQIKFSLLSFLFFTPLLLWVTDLQNFSRSIFWLVILITFFDYISQELTRILIFLLKPLSATVVTFVRNGIWPIAAIVLLVQKSPLANIQNLLVLGLMGGICATILGFLIIYYKNITAFHKNKLAFGWTKTGLKRSIPFLVAASAFKVAEFQDRFILEYFHGTEALGVYFFLATLAAGFQLVLNTTVSQIWGPKTIRAFRLNDMVLYKEYKRIFIRNSFYVGTITILAAIILINPALNLIDKTEYSSEINVFYILLASNTLILISEFWQMELYARDFDRWIPVSSVSALIIGFIANLILIPHYSTIGAAVAATISFTTLIAVRVIGFKIETNKQIKQV